MKFWTVASILTVTCTLGVLCILDACTARETAKDAYTVQSKACLVAYDTRPMQVACLEYVRNKWNKAGAPAADLDGGSHE